jgi:ParB family chromosome partitioning protein
MLVDIKGIRMEIHASVQWETPDEYLDAARELMGAIDIDPCTTERAQERIMATVYYTKETNGLDKPWLGRLWLNAPYDAGIIEQFMDRAIEQYLIGNILEGLILTHTNNTHYEYFQKVLKECAAACFVRDYIHWTSGHVQEEEKINEMGINWHPEYTKHGNAVLYLGVRPYNFKKVFSKFGVCLCQMKS